MVITVNNSFHTSMTKHFSLLNKGQKNIFVYCDIPEDLMEAFAKGFKSFVA